MIEPFLVMAFRSRFSIGYFRKTIFGIFHRCAAVFYADIDLLCRGRKVVWRSTNTLVSSMQANFSGQKPIRTKNRKALTEGRIEIISRSSEQSHLQRIIEINSGRLTIENRCFAALLPHAWAATKP